MRKVEDRTVTPLSAERKRCTEDTGSSRMETVQVRNKKSTFEQILVLLEQESKSYPLATDYLALMGQLRDCDTSDAVSEGWRRKITEWCYEVVDHFNFDREAVSIAMNYLDRAVASRSVVAKAPIAKREFQLLAVTSLYMSLKIHGETDAVEGPRRKLRIDAFVELSRGFFRVESIEATERSILATLDWRVNPPTTVRFTASILRLCPRWTVEEYPVQYSNIIGGIYDVARYLTELSVCVSSFAFTCKASTTAYAATLCAIEALQSTLPLPYCARIVFLKNCAEVLGLYPEDAEVRRVREMLKALSPNMFDGDEIPEEFLIDRVLICSTLVEPEDSSDRGKTSPICVTDSTENSPKSCRKRTRSTVDQTRASRPLYRSSF